MSKIEKTTKYDIYYFIFSIMVYTFASGLMLIGLLLSDLEIENLYINLSVRIGVLIFILYFLIW